MHDLHASPPARRRPRLPNRHRRSHRIMHDVGIPNGVGGVGYGEGDIPALVEAP